MKPWEENDENKFHCHDIDIQACSATDCTGLIPSPPRSEAELESYEELYPFLTRAASAHKE